MKTILAFDDFVLNRSENTRRRFKQPKWHPELKYTDPDNPRNIWPQSVVPAPQGGYMMVYLGIPEPESPWRTSICPYFWPGARTACALNPINR